MKRNSGFTLIEILVVIGVFSGLMTLISGIFIANFEMQRNTLSVQRTTEELGYAMEYMGKAIRMARLDEDGNCIGDPGHTYDSTGNSIRFLDYEERCFEFFLDDGVLKVDKDGEVYNLTSGMLEVEDFRVQITPEDSDDLFDRQPSATLVVEVEEIGAGARWWSAEIQSTITRRRLDVEREL